MRRVLVPVISTLALVAALPAVAREEPGIRGREAPPWTVDRWFNLPAGADAVDVGDFRGKVVYLFFFQHRCPACHEHGFPTLKAVEAHFADDDDVVFVAIQTTWRGVSADTADKALPTVLKYGMDIPVGHAGNGADGSGPGIMETYRTPGTPWTVIVDREGIVQFDYWGIDVDKAVNLVEVLLAERPPSEG